MYEIGEKIIYGSEGVFLVSGYSDSPIDKNDDRQYYILKPIYGPQGNIILTPVDNDKTTMRTIMSREDALGLIEKISTIPLLEIEKEKLRRDTYKSVVANAVAEGYVSLIKTVCARREIFSKQKRRLSDADTDYEKKAKFCLYGELSVSLDIPFEDVKILIEEKLA